MNTSRLYYPRHTILWDEITLDDQDLAHDSEHIMRVYRWTVQLAADEDVDPDLAGAAALVHDLVNIPKESKDRSLASEKSAIVGAKILPKAGYSPQEIEKIIEAVRTCSWSRGEKATAKLGEVLQDADRLDSLGAIGIMRNIACAQAMRTRGNIGCFYDPEDPFGKERKDLNDKQYAIDHYPIKLLKLANNMNTETAKQEAQRRHRFMLQFLFALAQEI
ncbi:MAG: hypothetical protein CL916_01040 [Deltaproteobacteria bacterium]|nr:hypothetical protein [Deltaproteobacteria bacterium]